MKRCRSCFHSVGRGLLPQEVPELLPLGRSFIRMVSGEQVVADTFFCPACGDVLLSICPNERQGLAAEVRLREQEAKRKAEPK